MNTSTIAYVFMYFVTIRNIILVSDDNVILLSQYINKIVFIKNKVKYIRKDERITVDK